jgi:hypothetical protein
MNHIKEIIHLENKNYVQVKKEEDFFYGGSQMWFSDTDWFHKDYILHYNGCGTIATADFFLYLALKSNDYKTPLTEIALKNTDIIEYDNYYKYVKIIDSEYTNVKRILGVLGPTIASGIKRYFTKYKIDYSASWKMNLSDCKMYDSIEKMLRHDIPVILSIGPNTPNVWGKKGVSFYKVIGAQESNNINGHYVTVTGIIENQDNGDIFLCISSWGRKYYMNYNEYRRYIQNISGTYTSSMIFIVI